MTGTHYFCIMIGIPTLGEELAWNLLAMLYRVGLVAFAVFLASPVDGLRTGAAPLHRHTAAPTRTAVLRLAEAADIVTAPAGEDCGCADDTTGIVVPTGSVVMNDVRVSGSSLRKMELRDADDASVSAGSLLGPAQGKAVVVFLRHLG